MTIPSDVYSSVKPYMNGVPDPVWENIVAYESNFNPRAIGDGPAYGGYSYGLFQLHVANNGSGQGNNALAAGYTVQDLLQPDVNARFGAPAIVAAWQRFGNSFQNTYSWWIQFLAASGHPGGNSADPVTQRYTQNFVAQYSRGTYGLVGSSPSTNQLNVLDTGLSSSIGSTLGLPTPEQVKQWTENLLIFVVGGSLILIGLLVMFIGKGS